MTRTLTFAPGDDQKFSLLYAGFPAGGNATHKTGERTRAERALEAKILRALKALTYETPDVEPGRALQPEGGTLVLEQAQFVVLEKYLEAAPFVTEQSDRVDDLLDWVSAAGKSE